MVPVYIAVMAPSHMLLAGGLGATFWAIPLIVFLVAPVPRAERATGPFWAVCLIGFAVLAQRGFTLAVLSS